MLIEGGDLDAGDSLTHRTAGCDVVEHRVAVRADEISAQALPDNVWGETIYIDERTVDVHVGRLRKAVNNGRMPDVIRTIRGAGYAIRED